MLAEIGVATTPGRDFDPIHGDDWVRLSFAGSTEDIAEAARRLCQGDVVIHHKAIRCRASDLTASLSHW
jgi:hypothetical protein